MAAAARSSNEVQDTGGVQRFSPLSKSLNGHANCGDILYFVSLEASVMKLRHNSGLVFNTKR